MAQHWNGNALWVRALLPANKTIASALWLSAAVLLAAYWPARAAHGDSGRAGAGISMDIGSARLINLSEPAKTVFIASPDVADIHATSPTQLIVYGKKAGDTTVFAISDNGHTASYRIRVNRPSADIRAALRRAVPTANITVTVDPNGITVAGHVASPRDAEALRKLANQFLGEKDTLNFNVVVDAAVQVTLRVQVAEVSRSITRALGFNWDTMIKSGSFSVGVLTGRAPIQALGSFLPSPNTTNTFGSIGLGYTANNGHTAVASLVDALDQRGLATILAEPTLTAVSGETADFLAGGEYPIPVPQGNQEVTVEYKRYGVGVGFTPTVLDGDRISIKVKPEVSQLTTVGDLTLNGVAIPALIVRRVDTTVELASGESFAIAGLFQNNGQNQIQNLPGLGNLPILGPLFRSSSFQRNESELVIIVTPYLVRPVARSADLHVPTEGFQFSSDIERILYDRISATRPATPTEPGASPPPQTPHLQGQAGFLME